MEIPTYIEEDPEDTDSVCPPNPSYSKPCGTLHFLTCIPLPSLLCVT